MQLSIKRGCTASTPTKPRAEVCSEDNSLREANETATTSFLSRDDNVLKYDANTIKHRSCEQEETDYAEVIPLNRRNRNRRNGDICLVAHDAPPSASDSNLDNQPSRDSDELQRSAPR